LTFSMLKTISLLVSGKVHGVFFRQSTREKAKQLGITGTVRNNPNGTVSILATGEPAQLDQLAAWSRTGPPDARVAQVIIQDESLQSFNDFRILH
ncbi:MAG TPA: acylphosphatase, partial [Chitinophagaceae bacterium]|nr:acylphosphatase [Chitinophagaceae bacterium]